MDNLKRMKEWVRQQQHEQSGVRVSVPPGDRDGWFVGRSVRGGQQRYDCSPEPQRDEYSERATRLRLLMMLPSVTSIATSRRWSPALRPRARYTALTMQLAIEFFHEMAGRPGIGFI
jgi:hypothetical protein